MLEKKVVLARSSSARDSARLRSSSIGAGTIERQAHLGGKKAQKCFVGIVVGAIGVQAHNEDGGLTDSATG